MKNLVSIRLTHKMTHVGLLFFRRSLLRYSDVSVSVTTLAQRWRDGSELLTNRLNCGGSRPRIGDRLVNGEVDMDSDCAEHVEAVYSDEVKTEWPC